MVIDRGCADAYDQQFASDVLWGNPCVHPRRIAALNIRQHRPGWHARDIAVEKAGQ
jgi:hypothetical protein